MRVILGLYEFRVNELNSNDIHDDNTYDSPILDGLLQPKARQDTSKLAPMYSPTISLWEYQLYVHSLRIVAFPRWNEKLSFFLGRENNLLSVINGLQSYKFICNGNAHSLIICKKK